MKKRKVMLTQFSITVAIVSVMVFSLVTPACAQSLKLKMTTKIPESITTPDKVKTSIGSLEFFDGVPTRDTVDAVYDYVDRAHAVEVFINMIPAVSMVNIRKGQRDMGATESH